MKAGRRAIVATLLLFFCCSIVFAGKLTIVGESSPPYLFIKDGKVTGIDAEIIKHIFNKLGIEYNIELHPLARSLLMLEKGQADIAISLSKTAKLEQYAYYSAVFTRNAEYVLMTNEQTKARYSATSLSYAKENKFILSTIRSQPYDERFWELFPWTNHTEGKYSPQLTPVKDIEIALRMLNLNRVNAFPSEKLSAQYTANKLELKNITHYDFVAFFKPTFNIFSKKSSYRSKQYRHITDLLHAYEKVLSEFKQQPEFYAISNWDWESDPVYTPLLQINKKETKGPTINIGFLADLSGPASAWGKPGLTGNQLFIDEVNANGGLLVDSVRYPLNMISYDDKSDSEVALTGAKELVEKHSVKFISAIGGASADATHPYLTNKKIIYASLIATDIKPDRPYLLAGGDVTPRIDMLRPWYHKSKNPTLDKWAVISQNDPIARSSQAWEVGAATAEGWDVVFDKHFATNTTDFTSQVKDLLASKPDVVSLNLTWPDFVPLILEQLYIQGYRGEISGNYMNVESNLKNVPEWFHEGIVDSFPLFNDPFWGTASIQHDFYNKWIAKYGKGAPEDVKRGITGIDWDHVIMLRVWAFGAQLAGSFNPDKIIEALRSQKSFPTLLGNASMTGNEMWGIQNMVSPPIPINETRDGVKRIQTVKQFEEWFNTNKKAIIPVVKSKGYYWK